MSPRPRGEHRRLARTSPPVDLVLAAIDATTDSLCACGCGTKLDPAGASAWFATPECQQRFQAKDATRPHEVWNRPDAAPVYTDHDRRRTQLTEPASGGVTGRAERGRRAAYSRVDAELVRLTERPAPRYDLARLVALAEELYERHRFSQITHVGPPDDLLAALPYTPPARLDSQWLEMDGWTPAAWLRLCKPCNRLTRPQDSNWVTRRPYPVEFAAEFAPEMLTMRFDTDTRIVNMCPGCRAPWPGPHLSAYIRQEESFAQLMLVAGDQTVSAGVSAEMARYEHVWRHIWDDLERDLVSRLYYRDPCQAEGCTLAARETFEIPFFLIHSKVKFCGDHAMVLWRSPAVSMGLP